MKITRRQLRQIIKEELGRVISESMYQDRRSALEKALSNIENRSAEGHMSLGSAKTAIDGMRSTFKRANSEDLNDLERLYDDILQIGRDSKNKVDMKLDIAQTLFKQHPSFTEELILHHLQRFLQAPSEQLSANSVPDGETLREEEINRRSDHEELMRNRPAPQNKRKTHDGGHQYRPWGRST